MRGTVGTPSSTWLRHVIELLLLLLILLLALEARRSDDSTATLEHVARRWSAVGRRRLIALGAKRLLFRHLLLLRGLALTRRAHADLLLETRG